MEKALLSHDITAKVQEKLGLLVKPLKIWNVHNMITSESNNFYSTDVQRHKGGCRGHLGKGWISCGFQWESNPLGSLDSFYGV